MVMIKLTCLMFYNIAIFFIVINSFKLPQLILAQDKSVIPTNNNNQELNTHIISENSDGKPPDDSGGQGTGSRGDCIATEIPMMLLIGRTPSNFTVNSHPTFWFYVPSGLEQSTSGVFSLQDKGGNYELWSTLFRLPSNTPGIVSISLPTNLPDFKNGLEDDTTYRWYFDLNCPIANESNQAISRASITGLITRDLQLNEDSRIFDKFSELTNLRLSDLENASLEEAWVNLLSNESLEEITQEPILGNVIPISEDDLSE